ncbi:unnamed protein product [Discosporangium mesarthrocarpum]
MDSKTMRFSLNGIDMGMAFEGLATGAMPQDPSEEDVGLFPSLSLEKGEEVLINAGAMSFKYPPPARFKPVASVTGAAVPQGVPGQGERGDECKGATEGADDGGAGGGSSPVDLSKFECASDLSKKYGPNRLKGELQRLGVKCGGTHYERAARLFSLKGLTPDKYPPGLAVKKAKG